MKATKVLSSTVIWLQKFVAAKIVSVEMDTAVQAAVRSLKVRLQEVNASSQAQMLQLQALLADALKSRQVSSTGQSYLGFILPCKYHYLPGVSKPKDL